MLVLTFLSILVVSVSAVTYFGIIAEPTVTINQASVIFEQGDDWATGSSMGTNSTYVSLAVKAYPNATLTYDEHLNISNTDASAHNVRLRHVSIAPASGSASISNFTFVNFTLIQPDGTPVTGSDFDYTTSADVWTTPSDMTYQSLGASTEWAVKIETRATAGATGALTCTIVIAVDIQE